MVFNRASHCAEVRLKAVSGYSNLQLVIAVVILALMMSFLLVFFSRLLSEAERIQVQATSMSLRAAVLASHEAWIAKGQPASLVNVYGDGVVLQMTDNGWPQSVFRQNSDGSLLKPVNAQAACKQLWQLLLRDGALPADETAAGMYDVQTQPQGCVYQFNDPHGRLDSPAIIEYSMANGHVNFTFR